MIIKSILKDWGLEVLILSFFIMVIIPHGAGITFDSVSFFQAGDHFWADGKYVHFGSDGGLEFAAHRFPLYPLIVSLFRHVDPNLIALQIMLFTALIAVFRNFIKDLKSPKYFLLLLATYPIFLNYYGIWTEGLYAVLFVWLLIKLHKEQDYQSAFWIILIVALLCLTRMVGIVVAGSLQIAYIIDKRPLRGVMLFVTGAVIIVGWALLGSFYLGHAARSFGYIDFNAFDLFYLLSEFGRFITPFYGYSIIPMVIGFALIITPFFFGIKAWKDRRELGVLFWFLIIHFYAYLLFIVLSKIFLDASIAFDARTLFPLMINFIGILILMQTSDVMDEKSRNKIRYIFPKLMVVVVLLNGFSIWNLRENGLGYNSKEWKSFEFISALENLDAEIAFTNDQAALYLYAPQISKTPLLPQKMDLYSKEENPTYQAEMDLLHRDLANNKTYVIWIRNGITGNVFPSYEELMEQPNIQILYDDWLCLIFRKKWKGEYPIEF